MDLDTLIYIIIMIVFIILGAVGKKKKPIQQSGVEGEVVDENEVPQEDFIARKLKEFLGEYDEEPREVPEDENIYEDYPEVRSASDFNPETYQQPVVEYSKPTVDVEEVSRHFDLSSGIDDDSSPVFEHENTDHELTEGDLTMQADPHASDTGIDDILGEFSEGLDARRAIIYSEIINRKKY